MSNSRKILVADDEPVVRQLIANALGGAGYDVILAENGKEAFDLVQKNPVSLVLTDINMPQASGLELKDWILKSDHKGTPVVLMTGDQDMLEKSQAAGATILRKPFRRQELVELINSVLNPKAPPK